MVGARRTDDEDDAERSVRADQADYSDELAAAASTADRVDGGGVDEADDEDDEYEEIEIEEVVEVDYTLADHAQDAIDALGTWRDVATWGEENTNTSSSAGSVHHAAAVGNPTDFTRPWSASPSGGLPMAPGAGLAVAFSFAVGALFGRRAAEERSRASAGKLADLAGRANTGAGAGNLRVMTEEERVADDARREKEKEEAAKREAARRKKRDEDEAKFVAAEKVRLAKEAERKAKERAAEEERRAKVRAELAERAAVERAIQEEKEAKARAEREAREREAEAAAARKREEEAARRAAEEARRDAERARRGETTTSFRVAASVAYSFRAARGDVEVTVRARAGTSSAGVETGVFPSSEAARVGALRACSAAARAALVNYSTDVRLKQMMGEPCAIGVADGGFDDVEFDHWMRLAQARTDNELRTLTMRGGAGLELKLRQPGGTGLNHTESGEAEFEVARATLPATDYDNVANRLNAATLAAIDSAFGVAAEDIEWVARFELGELHGLPGGLVFPAVSEASMREKPLKGGLMATMLTLSHWLERTRVIVEEAGDAGPGPTGLAQCEQLAAQMLSNVANAESSSWKAMYLDGFTGDTLSQAAQMAREVFEERDAVRRILAQKEEEQRKKLEGVPTMDEEAYPDREEARRARWAYEKESEPLAERLWAMRNSAAQLAQSGARSQARRMLEEAYTLRAEAQEKFRQDAGAPPPAGGVAPELLPELLALEDCFAGEASWSKELAGVRGQVLRAVRSAAAAEAAAGDWMRAAALLEGAAREYGAARKLGEAHPAVEATMSAAKEAWEQAGVEQDDEDVKGVALEAAAGTKVPKGQGGGIVLRLMKTYLQELEARRL